MITVVTLRQAEDAEDIKTVATLWNQSAAWLRGQGLDQWQYPVRLDNITRAVNAGTCWLASADDAVIGTITVDTNANPRYWFPDDSPNDALYIHRMVVANSARGIELGSALLDWAGQRAQLHNRRWLRLDAWRSNTRLHQYYLERGFRFVRMVDDPDTLSGACFERPAAMQLDRGPAISDISDKTRYGACMTRHNVDGLPPLAAPDATAEERDRAIEARMLARHGAPSLEDYRKVYTACGLDWPGDEEIRRSYPVAAPAA